MAIVLALVATLGPLAGGLVVWWIQSRIEHTRRETERLHSERAKLYGELLEPFSAIFGMNARNASDPVKIIQSKKYRDAMFHVNLVGSDDVVRAFNKMMKQFYERSDDVPLDQRSMVEMLRLVGDTMLAIRRELGNRRTRLGSFEMFESSITDLQRYIDAAQEGS